jgi:toxin-antitoxin system PIN domain toxin
LILFDANVLVHAFRSDAADHQRYKAWVESVVNEPAQYGVSTQALALVVRICTHPRVFRRPSSLADVLQFCRVLVERPNAILVSPGKEHWSIFESLCEAFGATGNLVQKAWFTALAIESGCEWITTDPDYGRFKKLI